MRRDELKNAFGEPPIEFDASLNRALANIPDEHPAHRRYKIAPLIAAIVCALALGGAALAFVMLPLVKLLSRRMKRTAAILTAFGCVALLIIGAVFMIVPTIIDQARMLIESLPDMYAGLTEFTEQISAHVEGFLGEDVLTDGLSQLPGQVSGMISTLLSGAGGMAGGIADGVGRLSLIVILAYYFLKDRERMLMQLELLLPSSIRAK